jgi:cytoskeletal protein CcmA (bactofilin family)
MFGKKAGSAAEPTVIGRGAVIEGKVRASGPIQIDGHVEGALQVEGQVSVGPSGTVHGELVADDVVVGGKVEGKVLARAHLHVASGGSVRGEARYGSLQIDRGGVIDGTTAHGQRADEAASAGASAPAEETSGVRAAPVVPVATGAAPAATATAPAAAKSPMSRAAG